MDSEKLIEDLRGLLKQYGEKIPYGELVGAPWPYSRAGDLVWQDPEPYFIEQAATALSTLQAENERLRAELNDLKDKWDKYQPREHWETLNELCENLRDELDEKEKYYDQMIDALSATDSVELERVKAERDAAIDCCSGYCATCRFVKDCAKHDMNDAAPIRWYYGDCEDWEWRG